MTNSDRCKFLGTVYAYSPYGQSVTLGPDAGNSLQYTGRENDGTGLYFYRARYYDPVLKQWTSEDPIGIAGGINLRSYVGGDPINLSDPMGLWSVGLEGYFGLGGGIIVHATGNPLTGTARVTGVSLRFGKGIGIQGTWDPLGKRPGAGDPNCPFSWQSSFGLYGQAGIGALGVGAGVQGNIGVTTRVGSGAAIPFTTYGDIDGTLPIGPSAATYGKWGFAYGGGVEVTLH